MGISKVNENEEMYQHRIGSYNINADGNLTIKSRPIFWLEFATLIERCAVHGWNYHESQVEEKVSVEDKNGNFYDMINYSWDCICFECDVDSGWNNVANQLFHDIIKEIEEEINDHLISLYVNWLLEHTKTFITLEGEIKDKNKIKEYLEDNLQWVDNDRYHKDTRNFTQTNNGNIYDYYCTCHSCGEKAGHLILRRANVQI